MKRLPIILLPVVAVLAAVLVFMGGSGDTARADPGPVKAGYDLFQTLSDGTFQDFSFSPLPAGVAFFGAGCDSFGDKVFLQGVPIVTFAGKNVGDADTLVRRLQDAQTTFPDFVGDTIDIEIVALSLVSVAPLTVTGCTGGNQSWEMKVQVPEVGGPPQSVGSINIRHQYPKGGTFDSVILPIAPVLTFTRLDIIGPVIGPFNGPPFELTTENPLAPWCEEANPLDDPPGQVVTEVDGLTTNFFPGIICPDSPHNGVGQDGQRTKRPITDVDRAESDEFNHKVDPAEKPLSIGGTTELLVGDTDAPASDGDGFGGSFPYAAVAAAVALALAAGGWYARRRWLRQSDIEVT